MSKIAAIINSLNENPFGDVLKGFFIDNNLEGATQEEFEQIKSRILSGFYEMNLPFGVRGIIHGYQLK